jgi:hypothetical protein
MSLTATPCHHGVAGTRYCWACAHPEKTGETMNETEYLINYAGPSVNLTGAVESIDAQSYPKDRAKIGIRDAGGGYSIVAVPREFARALSLGSAVSLTVLTLKESV